MRKLSILLTVMAGLAALAFVATYWAEADMAADAKPTQLIEPYEEELAALTGEVGTPIGSPQNIILTDEEAFLPGEGPNGERLANHTYLEQQGIYPLQEKTVHFVAGKVRLGLGVAAGTLLLAAGLARWRSLHGSKEPLGESAVAGEGRETYG